MAVAAAPERSISERALDARQARLDRFLAMVLDLIVVGILSFIVNNVYGVTQVTSGAPLTGGATSAYFTTTTSVAWPWLVLLWLAYFIVPEYLFGASLGKMVRGLCVVRVDGGPVSVGSILARNVLRLVDALPALYLVGGALVLGTGSSQRLGDMVAGTTVIHRARALDPKATRHPSRGARRAAGLGLLALLLFTIAFDYFGRPALVVEGLYNQHELLGTELSSYRLGNAQWGLGRVTYALTAYDAGKPCTGYASLQWSWTGWEMTDGTLLCAP
ncbi:MAG: hypothetical protein QOI23_1029 [Chloroflexota bacterium]|jgi:uncharacterized RDD family membrane protein YckC|nr:hypothetical protein [Chloroflexota bacterium]